MKIKLTDGPLKGDVIDVADDIVKQGYVRVAERPKLGNFKLDPRVSVTDKVKTYVYRIEELWYNGEPSNRFVIRYENSL